MKLYMLKYEARNYKPRETADDAVTTTTTTTMSSSTTCRPRSAPTWC